MMVLMDGLLAVTISGHRYAFHRLMKLWTNSVVMTGLQIGMRMVIR